MSRQDPQSQLSDDGSVICIDAGTTTTRIWLTDREGNVRWRGRAQVGVRDTARTGSAQLLRQTLADLIRDAGNSVSAGEASPACVIAAGMITSSLGLLEVPHIQAPAGRSEIAAAARSHSFPDITPLPVFLVPGVRTGTVKQLGAESITSGDLMRGEETLCVGLISLGIACGPQTVLNLGSHWKAIHLDSSARISGSVTSLAGEMIHAIQSNTILTGAIPAGRPESLDPQWIVAGMEKQRSSSLGRALFSIRLLHLSGGTTPEQRAAYLAGAFIAAEMDCLINTGAVAVRLPILLAGSDALSSAWQFALQLGNIPAQILGEATVERAMLRGLTQILAATG